MTEKEMWSRFCAGTGLDPKTPYEAWAFCGGGPFANELEAPACWKNLNWFIPDGKHEHMTEVWTENAYACK